MNHQATGVWLEAACTAYAMQQGQGACCPIYIDSVRILAAYALPQA